MESRPAPAPTPPDPTGSAPPSLPPLPEGVRVVREEVRDADGIEVHSQPEWAERFPWLVQGTTARGSGDDAFDLGLFGRAPAGEVHERWRRLAAGLGMRRSVHGRQVHEATVRLHGDGPPGLELHDAVDGHVTRSPGVLLGVSTADCIPVTVVDPVRRAVSVLHAGWRSVVAGIVERGVAVLAERLASRPGDLHVHLGPAVCGSCYEVGPEVHEALGLDTPGGPTPVDLRSAAADRAIAAGVPAGNVTVSAACTLCGDGPFFSHRGGDAERQIGFVGIVPGHGPAPGSGRSSEGAT